MVGDAARGEGLEVWSLESGDYATTLERVGADSDMLLLLLLLLPLCKLHPLSLTSLLEMPRGKLPLKMLFRRKLPSPPTSITGMKVCISAKKLPVSGAVCPRSELEVLWWLRGDLRNWLRRYRYLRASSLSAASSVRSMSLERQSNEQKNSSKKQPLPFEIRRPQFRQRGRVGDGDAVVEN